MRFLLSIVFLILCNFVSGKYAESVLTVVNPVDFIKSKAIQSISITDQALIESLKNLRDKVFKPNFTETWDPCVLSINQISQDAMKLEWYAVKLLDSWGKLESGILQLNMKWMGRYYECIDVKTANFSGKYFSALFTSKNPQQQIIKITIGTCFPSTCSQSNVTNLLSAVLANITTTVDTPDQALLSDSLSILGLFMLIFICFIVVSATLFDGIFIYKKKKTHSEIYNTIANNEQETNFLKYVRSFSAIENSKRLLNTEQKPGDIHCLHGMRFISILWVILGHSFLIASNYTDNLLFIAEYFTSSWTFQAVANGTYSVDTFFYLSGLLVTYLGMRELKRSHGRINVPLMYIYRYVRLTPAYAFMILMTVSIMPLVGTGPSWWASNQPMVETCTKYWWTNLLYINNLYPVDMTQECFAWGWYLANDMQFYLLAPLFLYFLYRSPKVAFSLMAFFTISSITITGAFSRHTLQQPEVITMASTAYLVLSIFDKPGISSSVSGSFPTLANSTINSTVIEESSPISVYMSDLYSKPWCRVSVYIFGMAIGYLLHIKNNEIKMKKITVIIGWVSAVAINMSIVFGLFSTINQKGYLNVDLAAFYNAMSRPAWCIGLAWVTVACVSGYGGYVNTFLSWKAFIPLSRLTYCLYLIHLLAMEWLLFTSETLYHFSIHQVIMLYTGSVMVTMILAYILHLLVEAPVTGLMKILTGKDKVIQPKQTLTQGNDAELLIGEDKNDEHDA